MKKWSLKNKWPVLIILCYISLRLSFFFRPHHVIWDEAVYLGMGKWLWSLGSAGIWEMIRPPVLPLLLGFGWKIGLSSVVWGELLSLVFGVGTLWMVYLLGKELWTKEVGILAALLLAVSTTFFQFSMSILTGSPAILFVLIGLWLFLRERYYLSGVLLGLAAITRFPIGLGFGSVMVFLVLYWLKDRKFEHIEKAFKVIVGFFIPLIPFFVFNYVMYRPETSVAWHAILRPWILGHGHAWQPSMVEGTYMYYVMLLLSQGVWLIAFIPGVWYSLKKRKNKDALLLVSFLLLFTYFTIIGNRKERFAIAFLPFVVLFSARGWHYMLKSKTARHGLFIALIVWAVIVPVPAMRAMEEWRAPELPPLVTEYANFPGSLGSPVLTADPLPSAYTDNLYIPYYFSHKEARVLVEPYLDSASAVIWTDAFWCAPGDDTCVGEVASLKEDLTSGRDLVFTGTYWERTYEIYE
ncbi:MAG: ArnT family glycosyltransferase [Candidatus Nanoarchaeia archaeon]